MKREDSEKVRLQKFLADQGKCSRREGEEWIREGRITVNGELAELGCSVDPYHDSVQIDGRRVQVKEKKTLTLVMNKPKGVVCSNDDPHNEKNVFQLLPKQFANERLFCAGRLDKDSEGLLILTNDGELAQRLTHPSFALTKIYRVTFHRDLLPENITTMLQGISDEGEFLKAEKIIPATQGPDAKQKAEIHLHHGKKREIRRLAKRCHLFVKKLRRIQIGSFVLRNLPLGAVRVMTQKEIEILLTQPFEYRKG